MQRLSAFLLLTCAISGAQEAPPAAPAGQSPQVKYTYLNVCTPGEAEQKEMAAALEKVPLSLPFSGDFEVTRGRTSLADAMPAKYVRVRRDVAGDNLFSNVQYSLSHDSEKMVETLVFKVKEPKDLLLVSIEDQMTAGTNVPGMALAVNTPASRIKLERFGKASLVLTVCEQADQAEYRPLFDRASKLLAAYRKNLRSMFRGDIAWLNQRAAPGKAPPKPAKP